MEDPPIREMNSEHFRCLTQSRASREGWPVGGGSRRAATRAALHELSEGLTAATNYLAAGVRLSERTMTDEAKASRLMEIMEQALAQVSRADDSVISLRKLLQKLEP